MPGDCLLRCPEASEDRIFEAEAIAGLVKGLLCEDDGLTWTPEPTYAVGCGVYVCDQRWWGGDSRTWGTRCPPSLAQPAHVELQVHAEFSLRKQKTSNKNRWPALKEQDLRLFFGPSLNTHIVYEHCSHEYIKQNRLFADVNKLRWSSCETHSNIASIS